MSKSSTANAKTAKNTLFIFDTCFLIDGAKAEFLGEKLGPYLRDKNIRAILPYAVYAELNKLESREDPDVSPAAREAKKFLRRLQIIELLEIAGEEGDSFGDGVFRFACAQLQLEYHLVVLTQDVGLMHDLLSLNESMSVTKGLYTIAMWTLDKRSGELKETDLTEVKRRLQRREGLQPTKTQSEPQDQRSVYSRPEVAYVPTHQLTEPGQVIEIAESEIPGQGAKVNAGKFGTFSLGEEIAKGGEGKIYVGPNEEYVAKIYKQGKLTTDKSAKIDIMIAKGLDWEHPLAARFAWPEEKIIDMQGRFLGFVMKRVEAEILANTVFIGRRLRNRFPDWGRTHLVKLCLAIVENVRFIHDSNVIIGDVNPQNIVVRSAEDISFIDTDSYQVEGYPCPVGTIRFTAPELLGKKYGSTVLTRDHEVFSVATLLFMVLHAGKPPYAQTDGSTPLENLKSGKFPYSFDGSDSRNVPEGPWKYIWSNLTNKMKAVFYETFSEEHRDGLRIALPRWQSILEMYLYHLENDCQPDEQERALFPADYRKPFSYCKQKQCVDCGRDYSLTQGELDWFQARNWEEPTTCRDCRTARRERKEREAKDREAEQKRRSQVAERRQCKGCRTYFEITVGEVDFFRKKGFTLPLRCESCRGVRKRW